MKLHLDIPLFLLGVAFSSSAKPVYFGTGNFPGAEGELIENPYPRNCGLAIQKVYLTEGLATVALLLPRTDSTASECAPRPDWRAPIYPIDGKPNFDLAMATLAIAAPGDLSQYDRDLFVYFPKRRQAALNPSLAPNSSRDRQLIPLVWEEAINSISDDPIELLIAALEFPDSGWDTTDPQKSAVPARHREEFSGRYSAAIPADDPPTPVSEDQAKVRASAPGVRLPLSLPLDLGFDGFRALIGSPDVGAPEYSVVALPSPAFAGLDIPKTPTTTAAGAVPAFAAGEYIYVTENPLITDKAAAAIADSRAGRLTNWTSPATVSSALIQQPPKSGASGRYSYPTWNNPAWNNPAWSQSRVERNPRMERSRMESSRLRLTAG